jgi:hypothetical protein
VHIKVGMSSQVVIYVMTHMEGMYAFLVSHGDHAEYAGLSSYCFSLQFALIFSPMSCCSVIVCAFVASFVDVVCMSRRCISLGSSQLCI